MNQQRRVKQISKRVAFIKDIFGITIGAAIAAIGITAFLVPFKAAPGGVSALSQMMFYFFKIPVGMGMLMFNIPLFVIGVLTLGRMFGFKTLYAITMVGVFSDLFSPLTFARISWLKPFLYQVNVHTYSFTSETFLGVIAGASLLGAGLGIVFKNNGSCGSTDIPALLLKKYFGITVGTGYLLIDTFVILASGAVFKSGNLILWSWMALFVTSKVTDFVMQGYFHAQGVTIISDKHERIREMILHEIHRGCTVYKGEGGYTGKAKNILYTVTSIIELTRLKQMVKEIDPHAFVIVGEVNEVLGQGFKPM